MSIPWTLEGNPFPNCQTLIDVFAIAYPGKLHNIFFDKYSNPVIPGLNSVCSFVTLEFLDYPLYVCAPIPAPTIR